MQCKAKKSFIVDGSLPRKDQSSTSVSQDAVLSWRRKEDGVKEGLRAPVLPDLRSGAGFTLLLWLDLQTLHLETPRTLLDGMSRVSGSLGDLSLPPSHITLILS